MTRRRALLLLLALWLPMAAHLRAATIYHVNAVSADCTNTGGAGTLASPWVSLCNAMSAHTFAAGDTIELHAGTYQCVTSGFSAACNKEGAGGGLNTVLPLAQAGSAGTPIIIENYQNDIVIIDGTTAKTVTWSACGGGAYTTSNVNVGSVHTSQVWYDPANAADPGTRLTWSSAACASLSAGTFSQTGGTTLNVRLTDSSDPTGHAMKISVQQADGAWTPVSALASTDAYITVRKSTGSTGSFTVKYGYHCAYIDGGAHDIVFDGVDFIACGGSDYGNGIRVYNGNYITVKNGTVKHVGAEGVGFYGGGPGGGGCDTGNGCGIQEHDNLVQNMTISATGRNYIAGGGNGLNSSLGMGVIVKDCNNCTVKGNTLFDIVAVGIHVTNAIDSSGCSGACPSGSTGLDSSNVVIDSNIVHNFGKLCTNGCGSRNTAGIQIVAQDHHCGGSDALGPCFTNFLIKNNVLYNGDFTGATGSETPHGITIDDGGSSSYPLPGTIVNNSINNMVDSCLDLFQNDSGAITFRNNAMAKCALGFVGVPGTLNIALDQTLGGVSASTHSNNDYWSANSTDVVFTCGCGTTWQRGQIVANFEATALQVSPAFTSDTNLNLAMGSGLIDTGTNTLCPTVDILGTSRPQTVTSAVCDVGAYEYIGTGGGGGGGTPGAISSSRYRTSPR